MITIDRLTKDYGDTRAVDGISLEIRKGEVLGLLGPNGAGKTTTLRILTGFLEATGGKITIDGVDIRENPLETKKRIGYLPESAPIYPDMLTLDYLRYVAGLRAIPAESVEEQIRTLGKLCGIIEVMHKPIDALSKGYRQRVGLAHALMGDPEILVLDEPTSGLDPNQIAEIRSIIKDIGKSKTIVFSTHILSEVEATCDRVVILNKGVLVADDSTDVLLGRAGLSALDVEVKGAAPAELRTFLQSIPGSSSVVVERIGDTCKAGLSGDESLRESFYDLFKRTDWVLLGMAQRSLSLEAVFRELTKEAANEPAND